MPRLAHLLLIGTIIIGATARADLIVAGPHARLTPSAGEWSWGGSYLADLRDAVETLGPGSGYDDTIRTTDLKTIDSHSLSGVKLFIASAWADQDVSDVMIANLHKWFLGGGNLLIFQDDSRHDALGAALGFSTIDSKPAANARSRVTDDFADRFGVHGTIAHRGAYGYLDSRAVADSGGTIIAQRIGRDPWITAATWDAGVYAPGSGRLTIVTDVDLVSTWHDPGRYQKMDAGARLGVGLVNLAIPETSSIFLLLTGAAVCLSRRWS